MSLALIDRATDWGARRAISAPDGTYSYEDLLERSGIAATRILTGMDDLAGARVCFLVPPGFDHVGTQWAIWRAGGIAVPLATSHPAAELAYVLDDAEPEVVVAHPTLADRIRPVADARGLTVLETPALLRDGPTGELPDVPAGTGAMILYTSGTTGRPKGVVLTHDNIEAQVRSLSEAWGWSPDDEILLHLPLHHVHGIVNVLTCALWNGAVCEILPRFNAVDVWERLARGDLTLYMAVPTVYRRLIQAWDIADPDTRRAWSSGAEGCRLMVSGSAALPVPTLRRWEEITGQRLLERYGMTEIGMGLSNPLEGERRPGSVGRPLPGVELRLVDEAGALAPAGVQGEIRVRGPAVFSEYWRRPTETAEAFDEDGYFRTGDQAVVERDAYRILGRSSVDIIKTGGEKISALEIEDVLREHPAVQDCAVVGVPDAEWGERVCAAVVTRRGEEPHPAVLIAFVRSRLAPYKAPKEIRFLGDLPRNAMGKVTKPAVRDFFAPR